MDLYDWFYKQVVSPAELSAAFEAADAALRGMVTTLGINGLAVGGDVVPTTPVAGLSAVVKGPVLAYDDEGNRIFLPDVNLAVDLTVDENGAATGIFTPGQERYLGIFIKFTRLLSDPRTDGDGNAVMFARLESAEVVVAAGAPAPSGAASRPALRDGHVLLADVRITTSQAQVNLAHILTDRTQYLFRASSGALDLWGRTFPEIVQKIVDRFAGFMSTITQQFNTFAGLTTEQFNAFKTEVLGLIKDAATQISFIPNRGGSGIVGNNVQDAIEHVKATIPGAAPSLLPANNVWTGTNHFDQGIRTAAGGLIAEGGNVQVNNGAVFTLNKVKYIDGSGSLTPKLSDRWLPLEAGSGGPNARFIGDYWECGASSQVEEVTFALPLEIDEWVVGVIAVFEYTGPSANTAWVQMELRRAVYSEDPTSWRDVNYVTVPGEGFSHNGHLVNDGTPSTRNYNLFYSPEAVKGSGSTRHQLRVYMRPESTAIYLKGVLLIARKPGPS